MKASDKIYVHVQTGPRPSITFSEIKEKNSTNIEYIRKDALLEWAEAVKADPMIPMNIDNVIEKIKSL